MAILGVVASTASDITGYSKEHYLATIVQNIGGNPVSRFLNTLQVIREGDETLEPGSDPSTAALFSRPDSLLPIHLGGDGFTYSSGALATGTVTSFELLTFEGALYSFSGFDGISAANAMAILNGNDALFYNLIQTTQWNYTGSDEADNFFREDSTMFYAPAAVATT